MKTKLQNVWGFLRIFAIVVGVLYSCELQGIGAEPKDLEGIWKQFWKHPVTGEWNCISWFVLESGEKNTTLTLVDYSIFHSTSKKSRGVFNIIIAGDEWSFDSDWGNENIGEFKLKKVTDNFYEGNVLLRDKVVALNRWERILKDELGNELDKLIARMKTEKTSVAKTIAAYKEQIGNLDVLAKDGTNTSAAIQAIQKRKQLKIVELQWADIDRKITGAEAERHRLEK